MTKSARAAVVPADNPICLPGDDLLERTAVAEDFARRVLKLDASQGIAVGVFGPWGSGKTSFVNLARATFKRERVPVLEFNPWLFSGAEQLAGRFFAELTAQMKEKRNLKDIGEAVGRYGSALAGTAASVAAILAGSIAAQITKDIANALRGLAEPEESIAKQREKAVAALQKRRKPIIVILDDADRLTSPEIREIFKLVRLTASLPNIIYILPCDRLRVEQALGEQGLPGQDYLEKIIQYPFDLPEIPGNVLRERTFAAIEEAFFAVEDRGPFDEEAWSDIYPEIIRPLIRNMRDVRRYAIALRGAAVSLEGKVAQHDMLALEAIRIFLPHIFRHLPAAVDALTVTSASRKIERDLERLIADCEDGQGLDPRLKKNFDALIAESKEHSSIVQAMIDHLFPMGLLYQGQDHVFDNEFVGQLIQNRRVGHEHILRFYLERTVNRELLTFENTESAFTRMDNCNEFDSFIRSLDPAQWSDILENLWRFESRFRREHIEPGIIVLLNLLPDFPNFSSDIWLGGPRSYVRRVVLRLLRAHNDTARCEASVMRILQKVRSLNGKLELVLLVGYREKSGHRLVSEKAAMQFEGALREEIGLASSNDLANETDPMRLLAFAANGVDEADNRLAGEDNARLTFRMLWTAQGTTSSGTLNSRAVRRERHLAWGRLIELYGDEATLKDRIESMGRAFADMTPWIENRNISLDDAESVCRLANDYAQGRIEERDS